MKRLTISMSDELFDKLDVIDNKSLFIRKLIERELDILDNSPSDDIVSWTDRFAILRDDVNTILNRLALVENSFTETNEISRNIQSAPESRDIQESDDEIFTKMNTTIPEINSEEEITDIDIIDEFGETDAQLQPQISENEIPPQAPVVVAPVIITNKADEQEPASAIQQNFEEQDHETNLSEMIVEKSSHQEMETSALKTETTEPEQFAQVIEQTSQDTGFTMPELKSPDPTNQEPAFTIPEQTSQDAGSTMPELKPPEQANQDNAFTMPELRTPEQASQDAGSTMPEPKPPEQANQDNAFTMPELKPPEPANQDTGFNVPELRAPSENAVFAMPDLNSPAEGPQVEIAPAMPDFKLPEGMPPFSPEGESTPQPVFNVPEPQQSANSDGIPPFMNSEADTMQEMQNIPGQTPVSPPATEQISDAEPDKLEGNILMYMPRGAKVKKEIIKSLVSRQFSQEDIDRKIQELVTREVLVLKQENGIEQLHRLK